MLNLLQVKTAGKEAFQWGECSAPGSKLTAETDYSLFRSNNRKFMSVTLFFFPRRAGLAAGVYSGLTYGLREARGCHDWVSAIS